MTRLIFKLLFFCLIYSCNEREFIKYEKLNKNGEAVILKKSYGKNGLLKEELLDLDSVNNGYYIEYNYSKIEVSGSYLKGNKEGSWYYMNAGDTVRIENWFLDKQFGCQYDYYSRLGVTESPKLHKFSFLNLNEKELCSIKFDIYGEIISLEGSPVYCAYNTQNVKIGKDFDIMFFWGIPPNLSFRLIVEEVTETGNLLFRKLYTTNGDFEKLDFANKLIFNRTYTDVGLYEWQSIIEIFDEKKLLFSDTLTIDINVRK